MYARFGEVKTLFLNHRIKKFYSTKSIINCKYRREGKEEEKAKENNKKLRRISTNEHNRSLRAFFNDFNVVCVCFFFRWLNSISHFGQLESFHEEGRNFRINY